MDRDWWQDCAVGRWLVHPVVEVYSPDDLEDCWEFAAAAAAVAEVVVGLVAVAAGQSAAAVDELRCGSGCEHFAAAPDIPLRHPTDLRGRPFARQLPGNPCTVRTECPARCST